MKYKLLTGAVVILSSIVMAFWEIPYWGWVLFVGVIIMGSEESENKKPKR